MLRLNSLALAGALVLPGGLAAQTADISQILARLDDWNRKTANSQRKYKN